jgi:hypothetical protein
MLNTKIIDNLWGNKNYLIKNYKLKILAMLCYFFDKSTLKTQINKI